MNIIVPFGKMIACGMHAQVRAVLVLCGSLQLHKRKELPKWSAKGTESNLLRSLDFHELKGMPGRGDIATQSPFSEC